jgi:hypothetical protein
MPLQKSFSEQNGSSRSRQQWHRSRSNPLADVTRTVSNRPHMPVSKITKNKLHAFNFQQPMSRADDGQIAGQTRTATTISFEESLADTKRPEREGRRTSANTHKEHDQDRHGDGSAGKKPAMTPVNKLAWQDLIGMTESKDEEEETSPNERLLWDSRHDPHRVSPLITRKKGRKRARSSSPISSPSTSSKPTTPAVNVKKLSEALKSPHADPALELWDRFSFSGSSAATPLGATNPALAQMMVSSSPRPVKMAAAGKALPSESGLRRAISCGANWPKRRRFEPTGHVDAIQEESPGDTTKTSMVNTLLRTMNGEINNRTKAVETQDYALKSPSSKRLKRMLGPARSPVRQVSPPRPIRPHCLEGPKDAVSVRPDETRDEIATDMLSDYGDDDFDEDTLMELDASLAPTVADEEVIEPPAPEPEPNIEPAPPPPQMLENDEDGFDDLDEDLVAAAEGMIQQIDSDRTFGANSDAGGSGQANADPSPPRLRDVEDFGDDAFGDDFGADFDFDAAEVAATQSANHSNASLPPVCR